MRHTFRKISNVLDGKPTGMKGQSLVELAITAPILIFMILATAEVGFLANDYLTLMDVVRESARRAVALDIRTWPDGEARNQQRMDCDTNKDTFALYIGQTQNVPHKSGTNGGKPGDSLPAVFDGLESAEFGFFDATACFATSILDPLRFDNADDNPATTSLDETSVDDIIVSVISYARFDFSPPTFVPSNPNSYYVKDYITAAKKAEITAACGNPTSIDCARKAYPIIVTGRWPLESRYCKKGADPAQDDMRDPFDYHRSDTFTKYSRFLGRNTAGQPVRVEFNIPASSDGQSDVRDLAPFYTAFGIPVPPGPRNEEVQNEMYVASSDPNNLRKIINADQLVRGYTFGGRHRTNNGCWGSEFTVTEVEELLNRRFPAGKTSDPNSTVLAGAAQQGGLVIVELHWQYHPWFVGLIFQPLGWRNDPILYIYQMFTVSSAEPTVTP